MDFKITDTLEIKPFNIDTFDSICLTNQAINKYQTTPTIKEKSQHDLEMDAYLARKNKLSKYTIKVYGKTVVLFNNTTHKKYVSVAKQEDFDLEKGIMMCLLKEKGFTFTDIEALIKKI